MDDRCWTDRRISGPGGPSATFSAVLQMSPVTRMSHGTVCKNEFVQKKDTDLAPHTQGKWKKLQEVGRRHGTNCPGVLIELSKWVIKYRVSRIKIHRSNLDSRFLPCRKKVLILTIYQPLGAHPLNLLATKIVHLFPHL